MRLRRLVVASALGALVGSWATCATAADAAATDAAHPPARKPPAANRAAGARASRHSGDAAARPAAPDARPPAQRQSKLQAEQRDLQTRLARLKQSLATAEAAHSEASDALSESESSISAANRRLHELLAERRAVEHALADVRERQRAASSRQGAHEQQLATVLRMQLAATDRGPWPMPIPAAAGSRGADDAAGYLGYLAAARVHAIDELRDRRTELAALEQESGSRQAELAQIADEERRNRKQLVREQAVRKRMLVNLSQQINRQRRSVASLERDEQRLGNLIQELAAALAAAPARHAAPAPHGGANPPPGPAAPAAIEPPAGSGLAHLRGRLRLPVAGEIQGRFGAARRDEDGSVQAGAPSWKGVFIRAPAGTEVHAVAAGRVVFADWLRGFGNLLIIDHGDGFLSVYGNNESLLRSVGDRVLADDVIAAVGDTGGSADSGLYFEMRYEGHPFDPLAWASAR